MACLWQGQEEKGDAANVPLYLPSDFTLTGINGNYVGLYLRGVDAVNELLALVNNATHTLSIYQVVNNSYTLLAATSLAFTSGTITVSATCSGTSIAVSVSGDASGSLSTTTSQFLTGTRFGYWTVNTVAGYADDFVVTLP